MSRATYQVELYNPAGTKRLGYLTNFTTLEYARKVNDVGTLKMTINARELPAAALDQNQRLMRDLRIGVYRSVDGGVLSLDAETVWFIRGSRRRQTRRGAVIEITAVDAMHLLKRRIVAYAAGTAGARKLGAADDLLKQFARENIGTGAVAARQMSGVTVDPNLALAPAAVKACAWQNLLLTMQEIANDAAQQSPPVYLAFDLVAPSIDSLVFRTYLNQRGIDRRKTTPIGGDIGNLADAATNYDTSNEITHAYAGGQGEGTDRDISEYTDTSRSTLSPYNRIEAFVDVRNSDNEADLPGEARAAVRAGRPVFSFEGALVSVPNSQYGIDFGFGDRVRAQSDVDSFDCRVDAVLVEVGPAGERIDVKLWSAD